VARLRRTLFPQPVPWRTPTEPWEYGEEFTDDFRRTVELRYSLVPYVYARPNSPPRTATPCCVPCSSSTPEHPTSWFVEDQYLFGTDILVAPLMEDNPARNVYLPPGQWIDYQTTKTPTAAPGGTTSPPAKCPVVMLVRDGAAIPHARLVQSTDRMDWGEIELAVYGAGSSAEGLFCLPEDGELHRLSLVRDDDHFVLEDDPLRDTVEWQIRGANQ
jgi:alpha-D-xyloside xylohydrolase